MRSTDSNPRILNTQQQPSDLIEGLGTIVYSDLEGGHYQIWADDGKTYLPTELANELKHDGLRIAFSARSLANSFSYQMTGEVIAIESIQVSQ